MTEMTNLPYRDGVPFSTATPFTYREGITNLELWHALKMWAAKVVPELNDALNAFWEQYLLDHQAVLDDIIQTKDQWQALFDQFMADIVVQLEGLNDQSMANLIQNELSLVRTNLDTLYLRADNKTFRTNEHVYDGVLPPHFITKVSNAQSSRSDVLHVTGMDDMSATNAQTETISSIRSRTGGNVVINGGGIWPSGRRVGLVIKDGVLIQGWEPEPQTDWGVQAFVFYKDGTARVEDRSTPVETLLANGAWNSVSFGKAAIRNGTDMGLRSDIKYEGITGRQCIGTTTNGDIIIITFPGKSDSYGATIQDVYVVAEQNNIVDLYMLDGGGSCQLNVNGTALVPSSDDGGNRAIHDALVFFANDGMPPAIDANILPLTLETGVTPITGDKNVTNDVRLRRNGRHTEVFVRIGVTGAVSGQILARLPRQALWPAGLKQFHAGASLGITGNLNVNEYGHLIFITDAANYVPTFQVRSEFTMTI